MSFLTLVRVSTGEAWHEVMFISQKYDSILYQCINDPSYEDYVANGYETVGCGSISSYFFFLTYVLLIKLIFLNLFIAIILLGYDDTNMKENRLFNTETANYFKERWAKYDPDGTSFINVN